MTHPIRVALIGYGGAGRVFHAPLLTSVPGLSLRVVASSRAEQVTADLPGVRVVADPLAAVQDDEVDLVVIASPNRTHAPLARAALLAGRHVVVDKPFALTLDEARDIVETATSQGRLVSVFQNRRWDSDFLATQAVIRSGRLGEVVQFESHFDRYRPEVRARWREQSGPGSGLWYDLGPHLVDQALHLFGLPRSVSGRLAIQRDGGQTFDWAHVLLDYGRLQVIVHGSMLTASPSPRFLVQGTAGSWIKAASDPQEAQLLAGMRPGDTGWGHDPQAGVVFEGATGQSSSLPAPAGDYRRYYEGVRDAVLGHGPNPVTPAQALAVMAVLETAMTSAATGQVLPLPLTEAERAPWLADQGVPAAHP